MTPQRKSKQDDEEGSKGERREEVPLPGSPLEATTDCNHKMVDEGKDCNGLCSQEEQEFQWWALKFSD